MESIVPTSPVIQQVASIGVFGLLICIVILMGATTLLFLAGWEKKRRRSIC